MIKRIIPNARNAVGDSHAGQTGATFKRIIPNARNTVRDGHAGQTGAIIKRPIPNAYYRHAVYGSRDYNSSPAPVYPVIVTVPPDTV